MRGRKQRTNGARRTVLAALLCAAALLLCVAPAGAAAAISGQVTDTAAVPLEGIEVCAVQETSWGSSGGGCTQTDAAGEYTLAEAGAGYLVRFGSRGNSAPGYAPQWYPGVPTLPEAQGVAVAAVTHVDAQMSPGGTVTGTVLSTQGSTPIKGVEVCPNRVVFENHGVTWCDKTDAAGEFALRGLSSAEYRFEFRTEGDVNYVESITSPQQVTAGAEAHLEFHLVPGVEVEGTLTEAGTGLPVHGFPPPYSTPLICALDAGTEARIKCTFADLSGHYQLPGLPPGKLFGVSFAVDGIEEGNDLHPDGFVRQYWQGVPSWSEATFIFGSGGSVFDQVDAVLSPGGEVFPQCEVASACPPGRGLEPPATQPAAPILTLATPAVRCKKGYVKVKRLGKTRCVKVKKKQHKHRRHHQPKQHRRD